jgi:hypothetical protein
LGRKAKRHRKHHSSGKEVAGRFPGQKNGSAMKTPSKEICIGKEDAVFWLDGNGRWHNQHGPFENRKIIRFFHAHIRRDADGYHVAQQRDQLLEKVYFKYEDTALFAFDIDMAQPVTAVLNTGRRIRLKPRKLWVSGDSLYMCKGDERIKFVDRALMKISKMIESDDRDRYYIRHNGRRYRIPQAADAC